MEIVGIDPLEFGIDTQAWKYIWNPGSALTIFETAPESSEKEQSCLGSFT